MEEVYSKLLDQILREEDKLILDGGCGHESKLNILAKRHPKKYFVGYDMDIEILKTAKTYAKNEGLQNTEFVRAVHEALPFKVGTIDLLYCIGSFNLSPRIMMELKEFKSVLRSGGSLVINAVKGLLIPPYPRMQILLVNDSKLKDYILDWGFKLEKEYIVFENDRARAELYWFTNRSEPENWIKYCLKLYKELLL